MTVERDLSRLRFLCTRVQKGEVLDNDDMVFILIQQEYLQNVVACIKDCIETIAEREQQR